MSGEEERSGASAGSVAGEPVAWAVFCSGERLGVYNTERSANEGAYCSGPRAYAAPLYRQPQPTLTDAEREAVDRAACAFEYDDDNGECAALAATLRALLERLK